MNPFDMLKNLGGMKEQLQKAQEELATITATGTSGGNMVVSMPSAETGPWSRFRKPSNHSSVRCLQA